MSTTSKLPTHQDIIHRILTADSIATLMGWAAVGVEYANPDKIHAPSGTDYANAAAVINRLLLDVCGDIETLHSDVVEQADALSKAGAK